MSLHAPRAVPSVGAVVLALAAGSVPVARAAGDEAFPKFADPHLQLGREVWLGTCKVCHTSDFVGAPKVTDKAAWAPRIAKGKDELYRHALNGFVGPKGTEMPPHGGNPKLSDTQVKAAVDYMVRIASH